MTYDEAYEETFTRAEVAAEMKRHSCEMSEFVEDCGDKEEYTGQELLDWLGY